MKMMEGANKMLDNKCIKRLIYSILAVFMVCLYLGFSEEKALAAEDEVIYIPDENFKAMINYQLGVDDLTTDVTKSQLASLTSISIPMTGTYAVKDITGISNCIALTQISFYDNVMGEKQTVSKACTDQLKGLRNITYISFSYVNCEDYSFMEEWSNLSDIHFWQCDITKLPYLAKNENLRRILIDECDEISDITSISKLNNLGFVEITSCPKLSDVAALWERTSLTQLYLSHVGFTKDDIPGNLRAIGSLSNLTSLKLISCNIGDDNLYELGNLINLSSLDLSDNQISEIDFLLKIKDTLNKLNLSNNKIDNDACVVLAELCDLDSIDLESCRITNYGFLDYLYDYEDNNSVDIESINSKNEYHIPYYEDMPTTLVVENVVKDGNGNYVAPLESYHYTYNEHTNEITVYLSAWNAYERTINYEFEFNRNDRDTITISHKQGFDLLQYEDLYVGDDKKFELENPSWYEEADLQWYKDGEKIEGATSTYYLLEDLEISDAGRYTLKVSSHGATSILIDKGLKVSEKSGLIKENGKWVYYVDSVVDMAYVGLAKNEYGWWHITGGTVDRRYIGLSKNEYGWWYVTDGKVDFTYTGMAKNSNGWFYVKNGKVDLTYTGLATNQYGTWYMVNGKVASNLSGLTKVSKVWMYLIKGKVDTEYTGLAKNANGWWYVKNGQVDFSYTGMAKNQYGWWYVTDGKLDRTFTGISSNEYGSWYLKDGAVDFGYTGAVEYNGISYNIKAGKVL